MKKLLLIFLFPIILQAQLNGLLGLLSKSTEITYADTARSFNYYVDNTGTGDTLSTIAEVNALSLQGLDTVFFKRGCEWREQLTVPSSGVSGYPIVFTSYGSGDKPIINGADVVDTWLEYAIAGDTTLGDTVLDDDFSSVLWGNGTEEIHDGVCIPSGGAIYINNIISNNTTYYYSVDVDGTPTIGYFTVNAVPYVGRLFLIKIGSDILFRWSDGNYIDIATFVNSDTLDNLLVKEANIVEGDTIENVWYNTPPSITTYRGWDTGYSLLVNDTLALEFGSIDSLSANYRYYCNRTDGKTQGTVFLYSTADLNTKTVEMTARAMGVYVNEKSYVTIDGLDVRYSGTAGINLYGSYGNSLVDECYLYGNRGHGVLFIGGYNNSITQDCKAEYNGNGFYSWIGADNNSFIRDSAYYSIYRPDSIGQLFTDGHGFGVYDSDNNIVEYCVADSNSYGINIDGNGDDNSAIFRYNKTSHAKINSSGIGVSNIGAGALVEVYYNLLVNNSTISGTNGIATEIANVGEVHFYNNTIYQTGAYTGDMVHLGFGANARFVNNIVFTDGTASTWALYFNNSSPDSIDYNVYYAPNLANMFRDQTATTSYIDLTAWNTALGYDGNSFEADPSFTINGSDFTLQAGSPAINNGTDVGLTQDILGNPIVGNPDIGAYEKQ